MESLFNELFRDIKQTKLTSGLAEIVLLGKNDISIFQSYYFNIDISVKIAYITLNCKHVFS